MSNGKAASSMLRTQPVAMVTPGGLETHQLHACNNVYKFHTPTTSMVSTSVSHLSPRKHSALREVITFHCYPYAA